MSCSVLLYDLAVLLTHWLRSIVLLAAATIGLMIRSAITKVYFYGLGAGIIVGFVWMLVMVFYGTYLQHKYIKHQRMLSGSRTTVRDDK